MRYLGTRPFKAKGRGEWARANQRRLGSDVLLTARVPSQNRMRGLREHGAPHSVQKDQGGVEKTADEQGRIRGVEQSQVEARWGAIIGRCMIHSTTGAPGSC